MPQGSHRPATARTAVAGLLALAGVAALVASFELYRPAPAVWRLAGLFALMAAGLMLDAAGSRALLRDAVTGLRGDRAHLVALAAIVGIGFVLRAVLLDLDLRYDEAYTYLKHAAVPIGTGTGSYPLPNNHLLNTVLMHQTTSTFGLSEATMRLPAFVAGVAIVPAVYAAGRLLHSRHVALVAAGLAAVSAPLLSYSVNARGYTMSWLAFAVLLALSARLITRPSLAAWSLWVFTAVLGLYAVPTTALALVTAAVWMGACLLLSGQWRRLVELTVAGIVTGVLAAVLYWDLRDEPGWDYAGPPIEDVAAFAVDAFASFHERTGAVLTAIFALLVVAGLVLHRRTGRQAVPVGLVALVLVPVFALALPTVPPFERSWAYLAVPEVLLVAAGVVALAGRVKVRPPRRHLGRLAAASAVAATLALGLVVTIGNPPGADRPVLGAEETLVALGQEGSTAPVLVSPFTFPSLSLTADMKGLDRGRVMYTPPPQLAGALLLVSRSLDETPRSVMELDGLGPKFPPVRLQRRFDEIDLYTFGS